METLAQYLVRARRGLMIVTALVFAFILLGRPGATYAADPCTLTGATRTCELWATTGAVTMPDGVVVTIWGYADTAGGPAQLPGPAIVANEGETLEVTLHNSLSQDTSLAFRGTSLTPDTAGVGPGGSKTYTINGLQPGTYMYEAGLTATADGQRQAAMGLFGALVVRPSANANWAYNDAATAFDSEALVVLSEIDPAFNADPLNFNLTEYAPKYWLINGKAYPNTDAIAVGAGRKLLIRYLNGGLQFHSMGLLGLDQMLIAQDGSKYAYPYAVVHETVAPGQTQDALVTMPATAVVGNIYPLFDAVHVDNNGHSFGGMMTFLQATAPTVTVTVKDTNGLPQPGLPVYAFDDTNYVGISGTTDANGQTTLTLPAGNYRFATDKFSTRYFSGPANHCTVPGCTSATITIPVYGAVAVTVQDTNGAPLVNQVVYAFDGATYMGFSATTGAAGEAATFNLPAGDYRFATDIDSIRYYSGAVNTCLGVGTVGGCTADNITIPIYGSVAVTVSDANGPLASRVVYAFDGATYMGFSATTDAAGVANFNLPAGNYRFATDDVNGARHYSGPANTCTVPTCTADSITLPVFGAVAVTVQDTGGAPLVGQVVYAFNDTVYTGILATTDGAGVANFNLPAGDYRFATDFNATRYYSGAANTCTVPTCTTDSITIPVYGSVTVTVADTNGAPLANQVVYAFDGSTYLGFNVTTDAAGVANFNLPAGNYRFATDVYSTRYYSGLANTCTVPTCTTDSIAIPLYGQVSVLVQDGTLTPLANQVVYAFDGPTYMGFSATTGPAGEAAVFNLPAGNYRFATDVGSIRYYSSDPGNSCTVVGCTNDVINVP